MEADMSKNQLLGCVADDFTGASDAASFLQKAGMKTILLNEVQQDVVIPMDTEAIVIALKSRTIEKEKAVDDTLKAIKWLEGKGASKFYFKYCSTFDSTSEGNIGPVADAVMEYLGQEYTLLCPALPVNGRKVKEGKLYVKGVLLEESPMKNHPLTPMKKSRIKDLIEMQSNYKALELPAAMLKEDQENVQKYINNEKKSDWKHYYIVPDYECDEDGKNIVRLFGEQKFLTGGSGLLEWLVEYMICGKKVSEETEKEEQKIENMPGIVLAGSCSVATLGQIDDYLSKGNAGYRIDPLKLSAGTQNVDDIGEFVLNHSEEEVIVYSSDKSDNVKEIQKLGKERIADLIEKTISKTAYELVKKGYGRIVVAGGETSGAVTKALGYDSFKIGESIAPGVPIMIPIPNDRIQLALKSGNFGQPDFFERALKMMKGEKVDDGIR